MTCCTYERRNVLDNASVVDGLRSEILRTYAERRFAELASVFMPDHVHLLIVGTTDESAFRPFMKLLRQRTAIAFRALRSTFLWQDGYFDQVLNPVADTQNAVEYIRMNPVRAGLVETPEDYPFTFIARRSAER